MSIKALNKTAVREVRDVYYRNCDANRLSDRDLMILVLEPLIRNHCLSVVADQILEKGLSYLASLSEFELSVLLNLDEKQSFHLMAVFEISRRMQARKCDSAMIIRSPEDLVSFVSDLQYLDKEHFVLVYLNTKNRVIGRETISIGTLNASLVHPREVFKAAIRRGAATICAAHNHPSGDPTPSPEDIDTTKRLIEVGELVGIEFLDHVIIGGERHISLKQQGYV
ncbi:DNA repair protein RadC [Paenibacillus sp. NPDC056579]|uniref:RadC family protein n=1 Tax=Paenibacillus sp. NPDC056579 TaxID=3345871 RepID=UPI0036816050